MTKVFRRKAQRRRHVLLTSTFLATAALPLAHAQTDVLTWHNDNARTGQDTSEAILTPANVNSTGFGLLANVLVDGKVDAQPLYISALTIAGKRHNVLFIATEHNSVYAADADTGTVLWTKSLLGTNETTSDTRNCDQVTPEIGITATPAIDRNVGPHGTAYVVAMSKDASGNYYHRIHALDLTTGAEQFNGPVLVKATYPGRGDGSSNGTVTFDPKQYKERPGLLLQNGTLYTSWGSHCDIRPYAGWVMTYSPTTLAQTSALDFVPNGSDAAPWNAGAGPAADTANNVYISLGNGTFDTTLNGGGFPNQGDFGNAFVKLAFNGSSLQPVDYWTMYNSTSESGMDADLGSGGLMLLPDQVDASGKTRHLLVNAGKDHNLYVADRDNLGHFNPNNNSSLYQVLAGALPGGEWSSPAYFNGHVYYGSVNQSLRSFTFSSALVSASNVQTTATSFGYPGTTPSVSAYNATNGIVWAPENSNPAVLHAYDANNLSTELYNSNQAANGRDHFGAGNKFIAPTVANGKVYVGTQNSVGIFGFVHQTAAPVPDGDYILTNSSSKLVLDDPSGSATPGIVMHQWSSTGGSYQAWFLSFAGNGYYTIQNVASKLFLIDPDGTGNRGALVQGNLPTHSDNQLWSLIPSGGGYVIKNKASGLVLDDSGFNPNGGAHIMLWSANGGTNQTWTLQ